jgi:hypothetical protein
MRLAAGIFGRLNEEMMQKRRKNTGRGGPY